LVRSRRPSPTTPFAATRDVYRSKKALFDHLVGTAGKRKWEGDNERFGGLEVDQQFDFRDLLHRQRRSGRIALMHIRQPRSHRWREGKSGFFHAKDPLPHDFA
jgi:hypothetical protein